MITLDDNGPMGSVTSDLAIQMGSSVNGTLSAEAHLEVYAQMDTIYWQTMSCNTGTLARRLMLHSSCGDICIRPITSLQVNDRSAMDVKTKAWIQCN